MRRVERAEILDAATYEARRDDVRRRVMAIKAARRVHLGPHLTLLFENRATVRYQIQEMLRIERLVREADIRHEIDTYNELLGEDGQLGCTLLVEIEDPAERAARLRAWRDLPDRVYLRLPDGRRVRPHVDERQRDAERASSVQFLTFAVGGVAPVAAGVDLPGLEHETRLTEAQRAALADDLAGVEVDAFGPAEAAHCAERLEDRNVTEVVPLVAPRAVKQMLPVPDAVADTVRRAREAIRDVLHGRDRRRLVVIVGPCSIHDPTAALEYAERLARVARALRDRLMVVMRTYFEKPRTTVGWKGLINDPHLDGSCDIAAGLELARRILLDVNALGVPCASEVLDPITPQYVADLLSWAAVGARTTESQTHREMASGLSMPVGFKNGTDGSLQIALDAMVSARHAHSFLGINADGVTSIVRTRGNPDRHIVLRGGRGAPNHADVARAAALVAGEGIARPVMVDCSHGNSGKDPSRQAAVCREVLAHLGEAGGALMGFLVESNLHPGRQDWRPGAALRFGVSITDACIGWEETEALLHEIAAAVPAA